MPGPEMSTSPLDPVGSVKRSETPSTNPHSAMKRHDSYPKMSKSLEQCLLKGVLNVVPSAAQGPQASRSPSKTSPRGSYTSLVNSTLVMPTQDELETSMTPKLVVLSQDGRLMQYSLGNGMNQSPEQILRLGSSSIASVRDGGSSEQWLLNVVSKRGHSLSRSRSLSRVGWSRKLSLRADNKRYSSEMSFVFDDITMLDEWLTTIRKAIEVASGVPYLLGLVSPSSQTDRNWLNIVTMPFNKPPTSSIYSRDATCPSRGSTSTSISSYQEVEWDASTKHVSAGSGSSVYTNAELDEMRKSRSSSYSSAQASSRTSLGNSDDLGLRQQKPTTDSWESHGSPDAPQTLDLKAMTVPSNTVMDCVQISPKLLISPAERTPTLPPDAVHLMASQPLCGDLHSPHESVGAATMQSWLDNAKVQALSPNGDNSMPEATTPSSAIFRDFEFSWTDSPESSSQEQKTRESILVSESRPAAPVKSSSDSGSVVASTAPAPAPAAPAPAPKTNFLSLPPKSSDPEFSPTLAAFPQPGTWQPAVRAGEDNNESSTGLLPPDHGDSADDSKPSDIKLTMLSTASSRAKPMRTVSSDSCMPMPMPLLQAPACSALHMRRRKTMPTGGALRDLPPAGPPPKACLPPIPASVKRDSGVNMDSPPPPVLQQGSAFTSAPVAMTAEPSSYTGEARSEGNATLPRPSSSSSSSSHPRSEAQSQRSSAHTPLPAADAIAELALQLSMLTSASTSATSSS